MECGVRSSKEVYNESVGFVKNEEPDCILDSIYRLGESKSMSNYILIIAMHGNCLPR